VNPDGALAPQTKQWKAPSTGHTHRANGLQAAQTGRIISVSSATNYGPIDFPRRQNVINAVTGRTAELVSPHCPHCLLEGDPVSETQTHLLHTCPAAVHRAHILNRDINNLFRKYTEPYVPHSTIDVLQWATQANITLEREDGWTSGIADKHDRVRILRRGPAVFHMGSQRFAEPWLQHILKLNKHLHSHELQEKLQSHTPADSIDPHLLNGIAQSLSIRTVLSPIASNYHIIAKTPSCHAHRIDTPLLLSTLHYKHTLQHARARANTTIPTAYLVPKDHAQALLLEHPELVSIINDK